MKLKELEAALQQLRGFARPKIVWEQYATTPHLAARMLFTAETSFGDLDGKSVCDLGCGCGMLMAASAMMGAGYVVGVDVDSDALAIAADNLDELGVDNAELVCANVVEGLPWRSGANLFDTVVMNPPFGTKTQRGVDVAFLRAGYELTRGAVYSLHKSSTREHILKKAAEWGAGAEVIAELRYNLDASYKFHKQRSVDIEVDLIRLVKRPPRGAASAPPS